MARGRKNENKRISSALSCEEMRARATPLKQYLIFNDDENFYDFDENENNTINAALCECADMSHLKLSVQYYTRFASQNSALQPETTILLHSVLINLNELLLLNILCHNLFFRRNKMFKNTKNAKISFFRLENLTFGINYSIVTSLPGISNHLEVTLICHVQPNCILFKLKFTLTNLVPKR